MKTSTFSSKDSAKTLSICTRQALPADPTKLENVFDKQHSLGEVSRFCLRYILKQRGILYETL